MSDEPFTGPPWAVEWTERAARDRDALPPHVRALCMDVLVEVLSARNPYVNEFSEPLRSSDPKGDHSAHFDDGRGWFEFNFIRRETEPQIVVYELFWQ
ncbi:hypothetical protein ACGF12_05755 [Kitasatospora sp. NPDC048296]|uniref:hypothetical protein n=1 Tax=Kitasatospora sp. NPDC048296 TaxID=3364048 RepID=UPI003715FEB2